MKINPLQDPAVAAATGVTAAAKTGRGATPAVADAGDATGTPVSVSASARTLEAAATAGSGIDEAKVAAVRAAIANGSFKVDSGAIADKLLANAQEFLSRARN
ncbi:flagellar biosynthesis anti-sigma factor FlgM [Variovorax paradoxus]|uniref:flagellar biosynthesis anti-sigma factor FlgM n=1 Tax=Variovorax paradoxus TaxID=34073 RepID=UPI0019330F3F|nr:flagellar biosynthesis anti-sigma factor FlgM [Variovorax paradoxus]